MIGPARSSFFTLFLGLAAWAVLSACDKTGLRPLAGSGGSTVAAGPGTGGAGGDPQGTGGSGVGTGGTSAVAGSSGTGGANLGTGGASLGAGGAGIGGASPGSGGAGTDGSGTGGASLGTGGASPGQGGAGAGGRPLGGGGAGGGVSATCQYPSCLWNLIKDCLVTGQCTEDRSQTTSTETHSTLCCSNGVDQVVHLRTLSSGTMLGTVTVSKDGAACYTVSFNGTVTSDGNATASYSWLDPAGAIAVKGVLSNPDSVTLICPGGESVEFDTDCAPDGSDNAIRTPGVCQ